MGENGWGGTGLTALPRPADGSPVIRGNSAPTDAHTETDSEQRCLRRPDAADRELREDRPPVAAVPGRPVAAAIH